MTFTFNLIMMNSWKLHSGKRFFFKTGHKSKWNQNGPSLPPWTSRAAEACDMNAGGCGGVWWCDKGVWNVCLHSETLRAAAQHEQTNELLLDNEASNMDVSAKMLNVRQPDQRKSAEFQNEHRVFALNNSRRGSPAGRHDVTVTLTFDPLDIKCHDYIILFN